MKIRRRKDGKFVALDQGLDTGEGTLVKELRADVENPEERYGREEIREALSEAIDGLADSYKTVFVLRM